MSHRVPLECSRLLWRIRVTGSPSYATISVILILTVWLGWQEKSHWNGQSNIYFKQPVAARPKGEGVGRRFLKFTKSNLDIFEFWVLYFPMNLVVLAQDFKTRFALLLKESWADFLCDITFTYLFLRWHWNFVTICTCCITDEKKTKASKKVLWNSDYLWKITSTYRPKRILICR